MIGLDSNAPTNTLGNFGKRCFKNSTVHRSVNSSKHHSDLEDVTTVQQFSIDIFILPWNKKYITEIIPK